VAPVFFQFRKHSRCFRLLPLGSVSRLTVRNTLTLLLDQLERIGRPANLSQMAESANVGVVRRIVNESREVLEMAEPLRFSMFVETAVLNRSATGLILITKPLRNIGATLPDMATVGIAALVPDAALGIPVMLFYQVPLAGNLLIDL
jgi:hypothetical protein